MNLFQELLGSKVKPLPISDHEEIRFKSLKDDQIEIRIWKKRRFRWKQSDKVVLIDASNFAKLHREGEWIRANLEQCNAEYGHRVASLLEDHGAKLVTKIVTVIELFTPL